MWELIRTNLEVRSDLPIAQLAMRCKLNGDETINKLSIEQFSMAMSRAMSVEEENFQLIQFIKITRNSRDKISLISYDRSVRRTPHAQNIAVFMGQKKNIAKGYHEENNFLSLRIRKFVLLTTQKHIWVNTDCMLMAIKREFIECKMSYRTRFRNRKMNPATWRVWTRERERGWNGWKTLFVRCSVDGTWIRISFTVAWLIAIEKN